MVLHRGPFFAHATVGCTGCTGVINGGLIDK